LLQQALFWPLELRSFCMAPYAQSKLGACSVVKPNNLVSGRTSACLFLYPASASLPPSVAVENLHVQMVPPRPERENSEREWHAVSSNAAGSSAEAGCSELTTADDADANAMHAMATLSQQLHRAATCTGPPGLALHVHVALQATADSLVSGQLCAKSSGRVRLACQAWLEWVLIDTSSHRRHGLGHHSEPLALSWQRSERYVRFASESTAHISRSAGPYLVAALRAGAASAGSSGPCVLTHGSSASVTALQSQHA
jgi:hypothetical protein